EYGLIKSINEISLPENKPLSFIAPGLIDLQVNGYKGVDFNSSCLQSTDVLAITSSLLEQGVTTYFPTVITNTSENIRRSLMAIDKSCIEHEMIRSCIGGIHLEGPFISLQEGPVGAHDKRQVKPPDWKLFLDFYHASGERIKIITLSPEWPETADFTRHCTQLGVIVSIGHTAATQKQINEVVSAGAVMSTHLGNATHQILPRHPNYIWDQLADDRLSASFISDGFHLPNSVIKIILKVKGDKSILVSDSVSLAGLEAGSYNTPVGGRVTLTAEGKLHLEGKEAVLAGSAKTLIQAVEYLYQQKLLSLADAWKQASIHPAYLLNTPHRNGILEGAPADLVLFNVKDNSIGIADTYKNGKKIKKQDK
ncbi:MAG: amidohydrolase family protein, partial [Chitinophagaceae bacterium]